MRIKDILVFLMISWTSSLFSWEFKVYNWTNKEIKVRVGRVAALTKAKEMTVQPVSQSKNPEIYNSGAYCLSTVTITGDHEKTTVNNPYTGMKKCFNYEIHVWHRAVGNIDGEAFEFTTGADPKNVCPIGHAKQGHLAKSALKKMPHVKKYEVEFR